MAHPRSFRFALLALLLLGGATPVLAQAPAPFPTSITTDFDPRVDGFRFDNTGDTAEREGNCWGMSLLSIDAYRRRRAAGAPGADPGPNFEQFPSQADPVTQATASFVQSDLNRTSGSFASGPPPSDPSNIRAGLLRLQATGDPEVMLLDGPHGGHAIVLFGYRDGAIQVYDPNFPGQTIAWPWSPTTGLGPHPLPPPPGKRPGDNFYDSLTGVSSVPFSAHPVAAVLEDMRAACSTDGKCLDRYAPLSSTTSVGPDGLTVRGQVTRPAEARSPAGGVRSRRDTGDSDLVYLVVNGVPVAAASPSRFGTFTLPTIPARALRGDGTDVVRLVTQVDGVFGGYADVTLPGSLRGPTATAGASPPAASPPAAPPAPTVGMTGRLGGR